MEILEQKRPLPRPHSPPKPLESDEELYQDEESSPLQLKNLSENSNRSGKILQLSTHKCQQVSHSTSIHRSSSLEHRLQGATSAIKHLEKELKEKNSVISRLQSDLNEKTRVIENYSSQIASAQTHSKSSMIQSSITSVIKKKEKELEKIIKNQQEKIEEDKKTMFRLQELNKNLVTKVKDQEKKLEEIEMSANEKMKKYHLNRNLVEENEHLAMISRKTKQEVQNLKEELKGLQEKYNNLLTSSMEFEYQTRELYKANQILNENILKLLESNQI
jgi:chromosome segregation ATPase